MFLTVLYVPYSRRAQQEANAEMTFGMVLTPPVVDPIWHIS